MEKFRHLDKSQNGRESGAERRNTKKILEEQDFLVEHCAQPNYHPSVRVEERRF